jgi:hypothetical protein
MTVEELKMIHLDPANWKLGIFYFAPQDPRIVVGRRVRGAGWTVNFARPLALPFTILVIVLFSRAMHAIAFAPIPEPWQWAAFLGMIVALCVGCSWLANPRRHAR